VFVVDKGCFSIRHKTLLIQKSGLGIGYYVQNKQISYKSFDDLHITDKQEGQKRNLDFP
jgi:hypothetical protein